MNTLLKNEAKKAQKELYFIAHWVMAWLADAPHKKAAYSFLVAVIAFNILLPANAFSAASPYDLKAFSLNREPEVKYGFPEVERFPEPTVVRTYESAATAYSSTVDQTDGDPFTTASGTRVRQGTVATNCLPFGTKIRITLIGRETPWPADTVFTVEDRMAARKGCYVVDVWHETRAEAIQFGAPQVKVEVLDYSPVELAIAGQ